MRRQHGRVGMTAMGLLLAAIAPAAGQGYGVYEQGACAMARGGAAVAAPCDDGSAIFFNPAALAIQRDGGRIAAGGTLIGPRGDFAGFDGRTRGAMTDTWLAVPSAYVTWPVGDRFGVGLGVFVPYGLTIEWPSDFAGRFVSYKTVLEAPYLQPTVAYKINDHVAVGGGPDIIVPHLELNRRLDLAAQTLAPGLSFGQLGVPAGTDFANVRIHGSDVSVAGHVGVLVTVDDRLSFGARYLSRHTIRRDDLAFDAGQIPTGLRTPAPLPGIPAGTPVDAILAPQFAAGGRLSSQGVETELTVPDQVVAGVAVGLTPALQLLVDWQFMTWSVFKTLAFSTERGLAERIDKNYRDTHGVRAGVDYRVSPRLALRGGFVAHQAAAPDGSVTPDLPEGARVELTGGVGLRLGRRVALDLAYQHIQQHDRDGRLQADGPDTGRYGFHAHLFGASAVIRF